MYTNVRKSIKSKYEWLLLQGKVKEGKVHNHDSDEEDNDNDKALNTGSWPGFCKQFKGKYCNCGKKGHKSANFWECPENKEKLPINYRVSNMSDV